MKKKNMRKKSAVLFLVMTIAAASITGCGDKGKSDSEVNFADIAGDSSSNNNNNTNNNTPPETQVEAETEETSSEEPSEEETREGMYRSELTNEWIDESLKNQRPVAIMVDNEKDALDHYGLTEADVVYELMNSTANGRITRFMAIVKDWGKITQFGSIRSTRPTNIMLAAEWNAVLCHDGGPFYVDEWLAKPYAGNFSGFSRVKNGKRTEYTEYVLSGDLEKRFSNASSKGAKYSSEYNEYYERQHYHFSNAEIDLSENSLSFDCNTIELPFPHNGSNLKYNESTGTYDYYEYGKAHIDLAHDNAQLTFKNLLIQDTTFSQLDANGYMIYNAMDSGRDAYYITNGKAVEVTWIKSSENGVTIYLDKQTGEEIELNTGKTYVALVPSDSWGKIVIN